MKRGFDALCEPKNSINLAARQRLKFYQIKLAPRAQQTRRPFGAPSSQRADRNNVASAPTFESCEFKRGPLERATESPGWLAGWLTRSCARLIDRRRRRPGLLAISPFRFISFQLAASFLPPPPHSGRFAFGPQEARSAHARVGGGPPAEPGSPSGGPNSLAPNKSGRANQAN